MHNHTKLANAIRFLSMDAVQQANSGHPGMPMGMADMAEVLWNHFLRHSPSNPNWFNRDRFVLSNGHGSMLLYSLLYLSGYDLSIDELKNFRQLHSKTPGHPEYGETAGVETTTGPLGQGIANAVGMAIAEKRLADEFNRDGLNIVDHHTYAFLGDGCLMEGVSHEACSLAGTLRLGKLIALWDDNEISIDGKTTNWFATDTAARFEAYQWHVIRGVDGHNPEAIKKAIEEAKAVTDKPTLICCHTIIGFGSPKVGGTAKAHGAPLGDEEIAAVRKELDWPYAPFEIPEDILSEWNGKERGKQAEQEWDAVFSNYQKQYPDLATEFTRRMEGQLPVDFDRRANEFIQETQDADKTDATRKSSLAAIEEYHCLLPELLGGSADLSGSNCTKVKEAHPFTRDESGDYIHYGVREFGMSAIMNGIALHGGFIPFGGTFLVFSDYARNAIRLSAMMSQKVIYVFTHDSIGLGEDGPTHQPISHAASLRLIPNLHVWRPCDSVETAVAWKHALETDAPSALLLTRQNVECQKRDGDAVKNIERGAYTLIDCDNPDTIIMATGSEVEIAVEVAKRLNQQGKQVRVVSMPCLDLFDKQDDDYKESVLPGHIKNRFAIEAASTYTWYKYVGLDGQVFGLDNFGLSAPYKQAYKELGLTADAIEQSILKK